MASVPAHARLGNLLAVALHGLALRRWRHIASFDLGADGHGVACLDCLPDLGHVLIVGRWPDPPWHVAHAQQAMRCPHPPVAVTVTQTVCVRLGLALAVVLTELAGVVALAVGLTLGTSGGGVQTAGAW